MSVRVSPPADGALDLIIGQKEGLSYYVNAGGSGSVVGGALSRRTKSSGLWLWWGRRQLDQPGLHAIYPGGIPV
jgi:hypothetical protein